MKWELEVLGGFPVHYRTAGSNAMPQPGESYTVFIRPVLFGSRRVPSWFFGDGTALFNGAADRLGSVPRITSLDPVITSSVVKPSGTSVGIRFSRRINRWAAAEFSLERSGVFTLNDHARTGIEASRNSYALAFESATPGSADSQSAIKTRGGLMAFSTGALNIKLPGFRQVEPFLVVGGGGLFTGQNTPNATLVGTYDPGPAADVNDPITDTVRLDFATSRRWTFVSVVGGGIKIPIRSRFGIAVEGRTYLYDNPISNSLSADHTTPQTVAFVVADGPGAFQFLSTIPPGTLVGSPPGDPGPISSLSGPSISGFKSFTETGLQRRVTISVGLFWRF